MQNFVSDIRDLEIQIQKLHEYRTDRLSKLNNIILENSVALVGPGKPFDGKIVKVTSVGHTEAVGPYFICESEIEGSTSRKFLLIKDYDFEVLP